MKNVKYYLRVKEILYDLEDIFGDYNKESIVDTKLYNPRFSIGIKDSKKIFNIFYTRFTTAIISIVISKRKKISYLRRLITVRLKYRLLNFLISILYRELISYLR